MTTCPYCEKQVKVTPKQRKIEFHPAANGQGHCTGSGLKVRG